MTIRDRQLPKAPPARLLTDDEPRLSYRERRGDRIRDRVGTWLAIAVLTCIATRWVPDATAALLVLVAVAWIIWDLAANLARGWRTRGRGLSVQRWLAIVVEIATVATLAFSFSE